MLSLKKANDADLELMMAWRSSPLVYQGFYQQKEPLSWEEHILWWHSRNQDWREFIIIFDDRKVGVVTIGQLDYWEPEIGIMVGEVSLWGKGIAKQALKLALDWLKQRDYKYTRTTILDNNQRSQKLFLSLGYYKVGKARPLESLYRKEL